jgi:flagellar protein FlbD
MIKLHKLNDVEVVINAEFIESIESIPETKIILNTGNQFIVKETIEEVIQKVVEYKAQVELQKENLKKFNK